MNLKHRKLLWMLSLSALGVGVITIAVANQKEKNSLETSAGYAMTARMEESDDMTQQEEWIGEDVSDEVTPTVEPEIEVVEEEVVQEIQTLEVNAYEEVNELIQQFLKAKLKCNEKKLKTLVTAPEYLQLDKLEKKMEFIESYDDIKVYTRKVEGEIDYIAYVYMKVKIASIGTKAPGLDEYYIKKVDGAYQIVLGDISDETAEFIQESRQTEDVQELLADVNKQLKKAMKSDDDLTAFCTRLEVAATSEKTEKEE